VTIVEQVGLAVASWLASGWIGYKWGLKSQKEGVKLNARIAALAIVDRIISDVAKPKTLVDFFFKSKAELKTVVFGFSCQLRAAKRLATEKALNDYQALQIKERYPIPGVTTFPPTQFNPKNVEEERKAMLAALTCLRDIIAKA
jgi:hypothetical protein